MGKRGSVGWNKHGHHTLRINVYDSRMRRRIHGAVIDTSLQNAMAPDCLAIASNSHES